MRIALALAFLVGCNADDVSRTLGARCDRTSDCDDRCLAPSTEYPGGFCTVDCLRDGECPGDSRCVDKDGGVCLIECVNDSSCQFLGTGWQCKSVKLRESDTEVLVCRGD